MEYVQLFFSLVGVVGLILLLYYCLAKLKLGNNISGGSFASANKLVKIIERVSLSREAGLALVKAGEKVLLVGISANKITTLEDLSDDALVKELLLNENNEKARRAQGFSSAPNFREIVLSAIGKQTEKTTEKEPEKEIEK